VVRLFCDGRSEPTEALPHGIECSREFIPEGGTGFVSSFTEMRALAARAGWTYVRWPGRRGRVAAALDKDLCPDHKPAQEDSDA
jgi:hypothetical protein